MIRDDPLILEINDLWDPVYPHMARYALRRGGKPGPRVLDLGPFAGGIAVAALGADPEARAVVFDETPAVPGWAARRARARGAEARLDVAVGPMDRLPFPAGTFEIVVVRGAFFFLTPQILRETARVLGPGGFGWIGGGYGPDTPDEVIRPIAERSRDLNARLGKRRVSAEEARALVGAAGLDDRARVVERGGLWIEVGP